LAIQAEQFVAFWKKNPGLQAEQLPLLHDKQLAVHGATMHVPLTTTDNPGHGIHCPAETP